MIFWKYNIVSCNFNVLIKEQTFLMIEDKNISFLKQ